jgi:hypothetical protein
MLNGSRGTAIASALAAAAMLMVAAPASAVRLGSGLRDVPNASLCSSTPPALEATCTETQLQLTPGRDASGGLLAEHHGVLTSWQVASGPASPATAGVRMRLRLLRGSRPIAGTVTPYATLPLTEPGIHSFPARLPIEPDDELGLDLSVLGSALAAGSAPIAHTEPRIGEVGEWIPPLASASQPITSYLHDTELLLAARIEPDGDRDEYGDSTQDRCPYDPRRHSPCLSDGVAPRLTVAYRRRQAFLDTGKILLTVKPNEFSQVVASAQLQTPTTTWGIYGDRAWISEGGSAKLLLELPGRPRKAGKATLASGGRAYVKCFLTAIDASGNRRHKTVRITPTGS